MIDRMLSDGLYGNEKFLKKKKKVVFKVRKKSSRDTIVNKLSIKTCKIRFSKSREMRHEIFSKFSRFALLLPHNHSIFISMIKS